MKSIYKEQLEYLESEGLKIGDIVNVEKYFYGSVNTHFKAEIVIVVKNPETYKLYQTCHFSDEPIQLKAIGKCSQDWIRDGQIVPINKVYKIKK